MTAQPRKKSSNDSLRLTFAPVTPDRWKDLCALFGARGACGGCWCMYFRLKGSDFKQRQGAPNRRAMKRIIDSGEVPGILGYADGRPVAWCSVAPRERFSRIIRSPMLKLLDDQPVWSVVCFFVAKSHRKQGVTGQLLMAAVAFACDHGARIVEGYPIEPNKPDYPEVYLYTGTAAAFRAAGFEEVARPSDTRRVMRYYLV